MLAKKWFSLVVSVALACGALAQTPDDLIKEFRGQSPAVQRDAAALQAAYEKVIDALVVPLNAPDTDNKAVNARQNNQVTLQDIALRAGRPGAEAERVAMVKALAAKVGAQPGPYAKAWLLRQLQWIGKADAVPAVVALLGDKEAQVSDAARRALVSNPTAEAASALRDGLAKAGTDAARIAFVNALGQRGEASAVPALAGLLAGGNAQLVTAAASALGQIGGAEAVAALGKARAGAPEAAKLWVGDAWLQAADKLVATGNKAAAAAVYEAALAPAESRRMRAAGLRGLALAKGDGALPALLAMLKGDDWYLATVALRVSLEIPGATATKAVADAVAGLTPPIAAQTLRTLAERGDKAALPQVTAATASPDEPVRVAAVQALAALGDKTSVPVLGRLAAEGAGATQNAARQSLALVRGAEVDLAILDQLKTAEGALRTELARALSARKSTAAVPTLVAVAANDPSEATRLVALDALTVLVDGKQLPALVKILVAAKSDKERAAAEKAVSAAAAAVDAAEQRTAPMIEAYGTATGPTKLALLRVLGKSGTPQALAALRKALTDAAPDVQSAAIVGLADWPTAEPMDDLLPIARAAGPQKAAALAAYIRMIGLSGRKPDERAKLYTDAWALTEKAKDPKRPIIVGLGDTPSLDALKVLTRAGEEGLFGDDTAAAIAKVGAALRGSNPTEVKEALLLAKDIARDRRVVDDVNKLLNSLTKGLDAISVWLLSPAYQQEGKEAGALFDVAFAPEKPDAKDIKWTLVNGDATTGAVIFDNMPFHGDNKVIYAKTKVFSPKAQEVRVEIGSDDGNKVWVNGKQVNGVNTSRGLTIGEDKAKANLVEGWNDLLIKIVNGGGNWSFAVQIRDPKGAKLDGLKVKPE